MPVHPRDIENAAAILVRAGARRIVLFGSALTSPQTAHDLDLACEGIPPDRFFHTYGQLLLHLEVGVDLIDLGENSALTRSIARTGRVIYDAS